MKRLLTILCLCICCISSSFAQDAFKHLGASVEFGTTGFGVNLSYPVITDRLIVTMGYNFPTIPIKSTIDLNMKGKLIEASEMSENYNLIKDFYGDVIKELIGEENYKEKFPDIPLIEARDSCKTSIKDVLNFKNFKFMVEFYPTNSSYFHITAGFLIGNGEWMSISAQADPEVWSAYENAVRTNSFYPNIKELMNDYGFDIDLSSIEDLENVAKVNIGKETYHIKANSGGRINKKLMVNKFKPYLGVGFGSSVPSKRRLGFQMEIGAYYQGKPTFAGDPEPEEKYDPNAFNNRLIDEIVEDLVYMRWYPQLTFRFTGRIF